MATAAQFPLQCFRFTLPSALRSNHRELHACLESSSSLSSSSKHLTSFISPINTRTILPDRTRASTEDKLVEDPKFVSLNDDDPAFGPPALLLMGFESTEVSKMQKFLKELDGEFLKIILCTEDMLSQSIWNVVHTEYQDLKAVQVAKSLPRICFMSGLCGEEMLMFIDSFPEIGLKPAVFAALVPNCADKLLKDVAEEIMGDHEMMAAKQAS